MEVPDMYYNQIDYIETASGNKVCRKSVLCGPQSIMIMGKVLFISLYKNYIILLL